MYRLVAALFVLSLSACSEPAAVPFDDAVAERHVDCSDLREQIAEIRARTRAAIADLEAQEAEQLERLQAWYEGEQAALDRRYRAALEDAETRREARRITEAYEEASAALALEARRLHEEIVAAWSAEIRDTIAAAQAYIARLIAACDPGADAETRPGPFSVDRPL